MRRYVVTPEALFGHADSSPTPPCPSEYVLTDKKTLIDEWGFVYTFAQLDKVVLLFSHQRDSDKLAIAAMRLYKKCNVVICDESNYYAQISAQA